MTKNSKGLNNVEQPKDSDILGITQSEILDKAFAASEDFHNAKENLFPVDAFPNLVQVIINNLHNQLGFPIDFIGAAMLSVASTAIGNTYAIRVNESWTDTAVLFMAIVGSPGTAKTPVIDLIASPLKELDNESYHTYRKGMKEYKQQPDTMIRPMLTKFIVSDATPEALAALQEGNKRGLLMLHDELAGLFKNFNRYHGGSEQENWLSIWSGQPVTIDRKTSESIRIARPFISVLGGIQPGVLNRMAANDGEYNGWMDRYLFAFPKSAKKQVWKKNTVYVKDAFTQWCNIINRLTSMELLKDNFDCPTPQVIDFTPAAWDLLHQWQIGNTDRINDEDEVMAGVLIKMEQYAVRFSLLLQLMAYGTGEGHLSEVDVPAVEGAIKLVTYFTRTAERVRSIIGNVDPVAELSQDKKQLYNELPDQFTTNEAVLIGQKMPKPEIFVKRFIWDKKLFERIKHGLYHKK